MARGDGEAGAPIARGLAPEANVRELLVEFIQPGQSSLSGRSLWRAGQVVLSLVITVTNVIGACAVLAIAYFVVPLPSVGHVGHVRLVNAVVAAGYVAVAVPVGALLGIRGLLQLRTWLIEERPATPEEQRTVLHAPLRLSLMQLGWWAVAAVLFGILNATYSGVLGLRVGITVAITGMVTAALAYFLSERILRVAAARALESGIPERVIAPGVTTRALLAWAVGTGLPVLGLVAIGILLLTGDSGANFDPGVTMVVLGGVGIVVGLLAVALAARATAAPVDSVRRALERVQRGEFEVHVPVYDATQIGQLQLGFNRMVEGLAERERIREAFGTYVDPEVAQHILEEGTKLEGEEVEVTILFIDVRDFTGFAERTPAPEVVAAINRLFETVVPIIHEHGGRVDKFVGDGLLAVFGAPRRQEDHADRALAAALEIERTVRSGDAGDLEIGIGLNSGTVVAGNVGGSGRLEFSVIGDPVNVAARVEAATRQTGDNILLAERTKELLQSSDIRLVEREGASLKGKTESVRLFAPEPAER
jgi:adenylate cyclase